MFEHRTIYQPNKATKIEPNSGSLFYPSAGWDITTPVELYHDLVNEFWFADPYTYPNNFDEAVQIEKQRIRIPEPVQNARSTSSQSRMPKNRHKLLSTDAFEPISIEFSILEDSDILTETKTNTCYTYRVTATGKVIKVNLVKAPGFWAVDNIEGLQKIQVFFYRGDSRGDGGSGNLWYERSHFDNLMSKMVDNSLMVIDGTDGGTWRAIGRRGVFKELCRLTNKFPKHDMHSTVSTESLIEECNGITKNGITYRCVGFAGFHNESPTMVWQLEFE